FAHFAKVGQGTSNPITLARAYYWQGRAADALGKTNDARALYETAARYSTAYYGQLARARLGLKDIVMRSPPDRAPARADVVRAIEILYDIGERATTLMIGEGVETSMAARQCRDPPEMHPHPDRRSRPIGSRSAASPAAAPAPRAAKSPRPMPK